MPDSAGGPAYLFVRVRKNPTCIPLTSATRGVLACFSCVSCIVGFRAFSDNWFFRAALRNPEPTKAGRKAGAEREGWAEPLNHAGHSAETAK